jgi:hypothetical protein
MYNRLETFLAEKQSFWQFGVRFVVKELVFGEAFAFLQARSFNMKYLVEEPNGNLHEITVPKNAAGQVCFEKVNTADETTLSLYISVLYSTFIFAKKPQI